MKIRNPIRLKSRSKYGAVKETAYGIRFASKKEANRYCELKMLADAGEIGLLRLQVRLALTVPNARGEDVKIGEYVADFLYRSKGNDVIEDAKGFRTPLYRWKKKHFEAQYGIEIREV